jgi:hypothetical protein
MIKIEVRDPIAKSRTVTSKAGKQFTFVEQEAYAFTFDREGKPHPYPQSVTLSLREGQEPYAVGVYSLAPTSVWVDGYRHLALAPKLVPVK